MQRREIDELAQRPLHAGVDAHGLTKALAAVHDPVAYSIGLAEPPGERVLQLPAIDRGARSGELAIGERGVVAAEQRQLHRARARVDDEDSHSSACGLSAGA